MAQFNLSLDPTIGGGWLIELIYFFVSISCWRLARKLALKHASASNEHHVWQGIAALFLVLCVSKQLGLETALTDASRNLALSEGWYKQRQGVQLAVIVLVIVSCIFAGTILLMRMRNVPRSTLFALVGATFVVAFLMVRAVSFHPVDQFMGEQILGLHWSWLLQMGGIGMVLMASEWRNKQIAKKGRLIENQSA